MFAENEINYNFIQIRKLTPYLDDLFIQHESGQKRFLTSKQRAFAWYYVYNGNNKTDAARRAYYSRWSRRTEKLELIEEKAGKVSDLRMQQMGREYHSYPIVQQAIHLIRASNEKDIKTNLPQILLEQLFAQATYDPGMFIDKDGNPKFKSWDEIPENYRCCVEGIETNWHGKDADRKSVKIKLVDREKARKYLTKLCPSIFEPEKFVHIHKTVDKEGKEIGIDYSKMSDEELKMIYKKFCERERNESL